MENKLKILKSLCDPLVAFITEETEGPEYTFALVNLKQSIRWIEDGLHAVNAKEKAGDESASKSAPN